MSKDRIPPTRHKLEEARAHWVAPKLNHFRAGDAEAGASIGPDGPETGNS